MGLFGVNQSDNRSGTIIQGSRSPIIWNKATCMLSLIIGVLEGLPNALICKQSY